MTQCTRKIILDKIKQLIEGNCDFCKDDRDEFVYYFEGGRLNIIDLLSIFTTYRHNLLAEIMLKLDKEDVTREDIIGVITDLMLGFNK